MIENEIIRLGFIRSVNEQYVTKIMHKKVESAGFSINGFEWRSPDHQWSWKNMRLYNPTDAQQLWHRDGQQVGARYQAMWATRNTTLIRNDEGERIRLKPYEFALINNRALWHRCPAEEISRTDAEARYFARADVMDLDISAHINYPNLPPKVRYEWEK